MNPTERTEEILEVLRWPQVGPVKVRSFLAATADGASIIATAKRMGPVPDASAQDIAKRERDDILAQCDRLGIALVSLPDEQYPPALSKIADPPPILYVRGSVEALSRPAVAVVGTRKASEAGGRNARTIARMLVRRGFVVVSGLALGIDTHAHTGAVEEGGVTVAVLAHGLDIIAPTSNRALAERMLACGGALVAEHPPGVPPRRPEFVRRNRIQSGLSLGSIIVESDVAGGAMHQANFTKGQGRTLMTVLAASEQTRGDLNEAGARHLIESAGAIPLSGTGDLVRELERLLAPRSVRSNESTPMLF